MIQSELKIWEGIYPSFAAAACDAAGNGFSGHTYQQRSNIAIRECLSAVQRKQSVPLFHKQRSTYLPPLVAMLSSQNAKVKILDFGGGLGIGYLTLFESIPGANDLVEYLIVELPEICEEGKRLYEELSPIEFTSDLPDSQQLNLIHSSSAIQYIEDWSGLLRKLAGYGAEYILLSDVFAGEIDSFVTLQNYYGSRIPHWFLNLDELVDTLTGTGYTLKMKTVATSKRLGVEDVLPMKHFPPKHQLEHSLHLLFNKNK